MPPFTPINMNKTNPAAGNGIIPAGDNHKLSKNVKLEVSDDTVTMDDIKMEGDVDVESSQEVHTACTSSCITYISEATLFTAYQY